MVDAGIAEILRYTSYIFYALAGVFLILTVVLFFTMKIKDVIYELSGKAKITSTQRMNDSYAVTGSLRTSSSLSGSLGKSDALTDNVARPTSSGLKTTGKTKSDSGNIRKSSQVGKTKSGNTFKITKDILIVHTNERIL